MKKEVATKCLKEFVDCLDDKYFLCYGTALGANREKSIISHDLDIDIGIMRDDFKLEYIDRIIRKGFNLCRVYGSLEYGFELSFFKEKIKIDLMFFYEKEGIIWNSLWDNGGVNGLSDMIVHSYLEKDFNITELKIDNISFYSLTEDYIIRVYGENWRKPVLTWNWRKDHLCIDDGLKIKLKEHYGK